MLAVLCAIIALLAATLALVGVDGLRGPLARLISERTGRTIRFEGPLRAHLISLHPSFMAEQVTIGNPPWSPAGTMAVIHKLSVTLDLPWRGRPFALRDLRLDGLDLHLKRDIDAHANWYWKAPGTLPGKGAPLVYSLSVPDAHVTLDDDRRHLVFDGMLTIKDADRSAADSARVSLARLRISIQGHLNGRDVTLRIDGEPLATVARDKPYRFTLEEHSSGSELTGQASLSRPFDFRLLEGTFAARGADLKDLYFLMGVILPNTGAYRLSGKVIRHYTTFTLSDLLATSGQSDARVTLVSQFFESGKSKVTVDLQSRHLRLSDLGPRAAARAAGPPEAKPLLLPETEIRIEGIRRSNSAITFHAKELEAGPFSFHSVAGNMSIDYGKLEVPRLSAVLPDGGRVDAHGSFDARPATPTARLDLEFSRFRVGQLFRKNPAQPPLDGSLNGHVILSGRGRSVHELASSANGTLVTTLPEGVMRASFAELAGANLRGLEMLLSRSKQDTPIRCAAASFQARDGTLVARQLMIDTDRMLISGAGSIQLATEALDLRIQGEPKHLRLLRLSGPLTIQGTLRHPTLEVSKPGRKVELIDPGRGKDADCAAVTNTKASAESVGSRSATGSDGTSGIANSASVDRGQGAPDSPATAGRKHEARSSP